MSSPGHTASSIATGRTLTRVSSVIYMVVFIALFGLHIMLWGAKDILESHHRRVICHSDTCDSNLILGVYTAPYGYLVGSSSAVRETGVFPPWVICFNPLFPLVPIFWRLVAIPLHGPYYGVPGRNHLCHYWHYDTVAKAVGEMTT